MDAFAEAGGNFLDTADVYSRWARNNPGGVAEEIIGGWMKERGNRGAMVIATKVAGLMWPGPDGEGLGRGHIAEAVEGSLRRLQTDYIDIYQAHSFDAATPIEETMRAFDDLVRAGKVRYVGASNYPAWRLARALAASEVNGWARYDVLQPHYNLVKRGEFERELKPLCEDAQIGVIPYSPLAAGFLTGKYQPDAAVPRSARASGVQRRYFDDPMAWSTLAIAEEIARAHGVPVSQVAIAWLLAQPGITAPIIGANNTTQLTESLGALDLHLSVAEMRRLSNASGGSYSWND
jgi:aryl-alcohol dehydrogenase-like predicted oxidoreductase